MANILKSFSSLTSKELVPTVYSKIVGNFPKGIQMAFAYGSGVFKQEGHNDMSKNMLDFIFVVDDPVSWHRENIKWNKKHYSCLKFLGPNYLSRFQNYYGAGVYFNTLIPVDDRLIKYGVISTDRLISDLLDWDSLYVSGRLHKPVRLVVVPKKSKLTFAVRMNIQSAVHAALLMMPESFSEENFYTTIAGLSYHGDFRMTFGEDKSKITNIVKPNCEHFRRIYGEILDNEEHVHWDKAQGILEQYPNHVSQYHHLSLLPKTVQVNLLMRKSKAGIIPDMEEVIRNLAHDSHCDEHVARSIAQIVKRSSLSQSFKSIFTAGFSKSVSYSMKKVRKMFTGSRKPS